MPPTTYRTTTIALAKVKAKHIANQAGLNRLQELLVKAASNPNNGQNYSITIKRALKSLQECKEPILTQKDAVKLKFVGPAMAKKICPQSTGVNTMNNNTTTTTANDVDDDDNNNNNAKKKKAIPKSKKKNSNSYSNEDDAYKSTTATATSIMEGIQQQQQQQQRSVPMVCPRPASSVISSSMARSASLSSSMSFGEIGPTAKQSAYASAKAEAERLVLPSRGPWKIILLIDGREHKSKQVVSSCKQVGIPCEERHLAIGDMAWIARCVLPKDNSSNNQQQQQSTATATTSKKKRKKKNADDDDRIIEILVGTIIERKDVADLASSLYGTRYAEQRLRLSQCGLPQVLFLVEGDLHSCSNCPSETLQMAMMETRVNLGFQIVQTKHLTDTVSVLKTLHARIVQRTFPEAFGKTSKNSMALPTFGGGNRRDRGRGDRRASSLLEMSFDTPPVPPFGTKRFITYPELKAKVELDRERGTRSIRAITLAMLKQIPTLSHKKCTAMSNAYPTMNSLLDSLSYYNDDGDPKTLIRNIEIENGRTIGPNSASEVYTACCTLEDGSTVASHGVGVPSSANPPMMMMKKKPPPSATAPPPLSVINSNNFINNSSNSNSNSNNRNKNHRNKTTTAVAAAVANNTKKPPPGMPASSVATARVIQKSDTNNGDNGVESSPKKMRMESINAAVTITTKNNSNVIVNKNITKSSSLQGKSSRKRPVADDCCDYDSDVIFVSSPADKERLNRETTTKTTTAPKQEMVVDLLTPESSPKSNTTKRIAMSRSSNLTEGTYSNNATTATSTVKSKPLCVVKRRTPISTRGDDSFLFSSSDDDTPHRRPIASRKSAITTAININNNNNNSKPAFITGIPSTNNDDTIDNMKSVSSSKRRKTPAKTSGRRSSLSSSDGSSYLFSSPEESPFPPAHSIDNSNDNANDNFDAEERKMSPARNLSFQNLKSNNNNSVINNNDVGVTGVVSLLDDDDDDDDNKKAGIGDQKQRYENEMQKAIRASLNNDTPSTTASLSPPSTEKIIARKVSNESLSPSSSPSSSSPTSLQYSSTIGIKRDDEINDGIGSTRTPPGVTTKRGGGCGNTFSAASSTFTCSSDGVDSNNNDPAAAVDTTTDTDTDGSPQLYKSLRERLCNKIPGKKNIIQEVIELDFDSD